MKTVLAALVAVSTLTAILPAAASEPTLELRRGESVAAMNAAAKDGKASAPAEAAPVRKIRVVLASPYGN